MKIRSLSATAVDCYENCTARFAAMYASEERPQELQSEAAGLGTACHEALDACIDDLPVSMEALKAAFDIAYWKVFTEKSDRYDDGIEMLRTWQKRQNWDNRTVLMHEVKESIQIPVAGHESVKFNYIWDRCDRVETPRGLEIDIVDFKTVAQPVQPGDLKKKIQPRAYALAAAIRFKDLQPARIRVTYDLLRYDQVSTTFTRDDNRDTWQYLQALAKRVIEDDAPKETVCSDCRWCIRAGACDALRVHRAAGGILALDDPFEAADLRLDVMHQITGLKQYLGGIDDFLMRWMAAQGEDGITEFATDRTTVSAKVKGQRAISSERAANVIGPALVAELGTLTVGAVDKLLKGNELVPEQKDALRSLITKSYGAPHINTKPISPHEED